MRYLKVLLLVCVFFLVMMFFVQNQASFADPVILRADLFFLPAMESIPIPLYSLMLICFALGALLVLLMLMWDRITLTGKLTKARRRAIALQKKVEKLAESLQKAEEEKTLAQQKMKDELKLAEQRVAAALRASHPLPAAVSAKAEPASKGFFAKQQAEPAAQTQEKPAIATGLSISERQTETGAETLAETGAETVLEEAGASQGKRGFFSRKPKA